MHTSYTPNAEVNCITILSEPIETPKPVYKPSAPAKNYLKLRLDSEYKFAENMR